MESRLMFALFFVIATMLMGIGVIAVLTMQMGTAKPIMLAAAAGFVLALPATWAVAHQIVKAKR